MVYKLLSPPFDNYRISDTGIVQRCTSEDHWKSLGGTISDSGCLVVFLVSKCCIQKRAIHRLVANYFVPNPSNYKYVKHKDNNLLNNRADNLEWCKYQDIHTSRYSTQPKPIVCEETGVVYESGYQLSRAVNVTPSAVYRSLRLGKSLKGLHYKYSTNLL